MAVMMVEGVSQSGMDGSKLARLNESEKRVLRLLAEGHTSKSIANLAESTPTAVNERLREARRKTGSSSSRELARALRALENRDKKIEVAAPRSDGATTAPTDVPYWQSKTRVVTMAVLILAAAAGTLGLMSQTSQSAPPDPLIGGPVMTADPAGWHAQVRAQERDASWAPRAEKALHQRFQRVPHVGVAGTQLRVMCATSICEVAGTIDASPNSPANPLRQSMRELQGRPLHNDLLKIGLNNQGALFTATNSEPRRPAFFFYFLRANR